MEQEKQNPAAFADAGRAPMLICLAAIASEDTSDSLISQHLRRRFGLSAELAEIVRHLAGLGPKEASK
ncbi:hypothetical protein M2323_001778 [Rhodoblastus acidophilus]|uniref:hypothetical protein n=1 Tax=Rhodoblastus acidophilus TaxID=1074 RepID=UPI0022241FB6|nr:hypothetical protein [Rhodoblastus acidophilus]MCW2283790.1 hypothetical protein [Rhodoblastus acidophilus]MCW2332861.1 hypothetical protein [Rhodoblastus acidophilus]